MPETSPKPFVFVVMPFAPEFDDIYKLGIKPAAEEAGYYCERLDEQIFDETMVARIYNQIGKADIVIGDMTGRNPNVFYEIGYAHALNKRTVLLTKEDSDIPFDLTHHFHIVYQGKITELKHRLNERLRHYINNPDSEAIDPFQSLKLSINGIDLDLTKKETQHITADHYFDVDEDNAGHAAALEISGHLPPDDQIENITCEILLFSSKEFIRCLNKISPSSYTEYQTIRHSGDYLIHKPLQHLDVSRGSWDTVSFHLRKSQGNEALPETTSVRIRILSDGLVRDIELDVKIPAQEIRR